MPGRLCRLRHLSAASRLPPWREPETPLTRGLESRQALWSRKNPGLPRDAGTCTGPMSPPVPPDKQAKLDAIVDRSRSYIANEAIVCDSDLYEWQTRRIEERLERTQTGSVSVANLSCRRAGAFVSSQGTPPCAMPCRWRSTASQYRLRTFSLNLAAAPEFIRKWAECQTGRTIDVTTWTPRAARRFGCRC